jgi:hypothetical protein
LPAERMPGGRGITAGEDRDRQGIRGTHGIAVVYR